MIVMGAANVFGAVIVAVSAKYIPREVLFGIGGIIHMGIMIGFLIWVPEETKHIHFILAASWGMCDAVWQTQCNSKLSNKLNHIIYFVNNHKTRNTTPNMNIKENIITETCCAH